MAGPGKKRAQAEKQSSSSSDAQQSTRGSSGRDVATQRSSKSIPRLDGNRDPKIAEGKAPSDYSNLKDLKNISEFLGLKGWYAARGLTAPEGLPQRPVKLNTLGKPCNLVLNTYNVLGAPAQVVHQYDVDWAGETDRTKRVLLKKIWNSKAVKTALGEPNSLWIYDGNKLAWSAKRLDRDEMRIVVDLDKEENETRVAAGQAPRQARADKKNVHKVFIRWTRTIDFAALGAFLAGRADWSPECIDMINFLDHVLREGPAQKYTQIKKSFFQRGEQRFDLGGGIEAFKGVFSSLRPALNNEMQKTLTVNVDVANGTFWRAQELSRSILHVFNCTMPQFQSRFRDAQRDWHKSTLKKDLSRYGRITVTATHIKGQENKWIIDKFVGKDPTQATFPNPDNAGQQITVANYFRKKYNLPCLASVPLVQMTKKIRGGPVYIPLEYLRIDPNQRYNSKLSDRQTAEMIKFAVTPPKQRWAAVEHGVKLLDWRNDEYLKHYGIKVSPTAAKIKATVLPLPNVLFAGNVAIRPDDLTNGRWRVEGKKFIATNEQTRREIFSWGLCAIAGRGALSKVQVETFIDNFIKIYEGHGGKFNPTKGKRPFIMEGNLAKGGEMISDLFQQTGNYFKSRPTFLMFIVNDRNVDVYRRIKKSCDCRYGLVSQVLQSRNVERNQGQYISNVCLKVNAKLGGATCYTKSTTIPKINPKSASIPTMIVGADVSHPAPGAGSDSAPSYAAITVSMDTSFTRYLAECNTNGNRVEMVTTDNIDKHFGNMAKKWVQRVGNGHAPQRVLYIRDGVSEGQYAAVLEEEVRDMKQVFVQAGCKDIPKFTVVIAGKRHHIRFFPEHGDKNGNPIPGTLVETGCTHPHEFDWYLCPHVAIKGTARPIHYQCILNEGNYHGAELQQLIFEHSFQYVRATTPVSLHPAVYYAHLAADRSRAHENNAPVSSGKKEAKAEQAEAKTSTSSSKSTVEIQPLIPLSNGAGLMDSMWFI